MADSVEGESSDQKTNPANDDVFVNGESDSSRSNNLLHPEYGGLPEQVLPRRSSLVKDPNRRTKDRKTVSFSSMPNERTVINGKSAAAGEWWGQGHSQREIAARNIVWGTSLIQSACDML